MEPNGGLVLSASRIWPSTCSLAGVNLPVAHRAFRQHLADDGAADVHVLRQGGHINRNIAAAVAAAGAHHAHPEAVGHPAVAVHRHTGHVSGIYHHAGLIPGHRLAESGTVGGGGHRAVPAQAQAAVLSGLQGGVRCRLAPQQAALHAVLWPVGSGV